MPEDTQAQIDERDRATLNRLLTNRKPDANQTVEIEVLREKAKEYGEAIIATARHSRERSLALTNLEQSLMWGVKGIVLNGGGD